MIKTKTLFATASKSYKKTLSYKKLKKTSKTVYTSITLIILALFLIANISATEENLSNQTLQDNLSLIQNNISFVIENNSLPEIETNNETANTTPEIPILQTIPAPEEENPTNLPENNQEDSPQINSSLISPQSTEPRFSLFTTPSISAVILNSTNPSTNDTNQNLTGFVTATDADSDNITFDYNWYKNGVLNSTTFFNDGTAILYLPLNNDTLDYALANDGSVINGALLNMNGGKVGGAYQFDGVNDFINFSASAISIGNNDRTISLWMKTPAAPAAGKSLWDTKQSDDFALSTIQLLTSGKIRFNVRDTAAEGGDEISGGTFDTTKVVSDNEWHLITAIWDTTNNAAYIYIDGVVNATATGITAIGTVTDTATANIGAAKDSANPAGVNFFNGTIDELILYNRTLSALEVKQLYIAGRDGGNVMGASQTEIGDNWTLGVRAADYENWSAETNSSSIQVLGNVVPVISSVILNSTDTTVNDTTENLTSLVTATDSNTDNMTFIYNWYKENILNSTTAFFNGLALYLPLNNDTIDYGTNHTVEVLSAPAQIVSKVGNGYKFDGSDDYLRIVHEPVLNSTNEYTYSFWVNTTTTSNLVVVEKQIGGIGKNIIFSDDGNCGGRWVAGISTDAGDLICAGIEINDAKWHHIVVVLNSSNSSFYIDSILQASKDPSGTFNQGIGNITIGARNTGSFAFPGMIDEFQIYNRSLSKHEVYQLYIGSNWSGHTMHSSRLANSDNWTLGVKAGDSTGFSNETNSSNLQVYAVQTAPTISSVILNSSNPLTNDSNQNLTSLVTATDINLDNITFAYNWYKNNILNSTTLINDGNTRIYLPFNNDTLDYVLGNDGTVIGGALLNMGGGKVGGAYQFDGAGDLVNASISSYIFDAANLWFKPALTVNPSSPCQTLLQLKEMGSTNYFIISTGGCTGGITDETLAIFHNSTDGRTAIISQNFSAGTWYSLGFTWNGTSYDIYIDSVKQIVINGSTGEKFHASRLVNANIAIVGGDHFNEFTNGTIDEVQIYNRTLSALEVRQLYIAGNFSGYTMGASQTEVGDNWTLGVRGGDYVAFGAEVNSSRIDIKASDETPPVVTINQPINKTLNSLPVLFNVTVNEDSTTAQLSLNAGINNVTMQNNANRDFNTTNTSLADGSYTVNYYVNDTANNYNNTERRSFTLDTIFPTVQYVDPTSTGSTFTTLKDILVNVTSTDSNSLSNITIQLFNSSGSRIRYNTTSTSPNNINYSLLTDGTYTFNATATDAGNNINSTASRNITIDTLAPTIQYTNPSAATNTFTNLKDILVNITSVDTNLVNITIQLFNSSGARIRYNTTSTSPNNINYSLLTDDTYTFNATAADLANNINSSSSRNVTIDTLAPTIQFVSPTNATGLFTTETNITINVTATDTSLANITIQLFNSSGARIRYNTTSTSPNNITYANLADGVYFFNATATDLANNINSTETRNITIDTTLPTIQFVSPTNATGLFTTETNITINITSIDTNLANITIQLFNSSGARIRYNTTTTSPNNITYTSLTDGTYTFNATAADLVNNINSTSSRNITVDTTLPLISYISPTQDDGANISADYIYINVSLTETNFANITFYLYNDTEAVNTTSYTSQTLFINFSSLTANNYSYQANITDLANQKNSTGIRKIRLDTASPTIQFVSPTETNNTFANRNYLLANATASDPQLTNITIFLFNSSLNLIDNTTTTTSPNFKNYSSLANGRYFIVANATDSSNNINSTEIRTVTLDTIQPTIQFVDPSAATNTFTNLKDILVNITSVDTNLANITIQLFNSSGARIRYNTTTTSPNNINYSNLADGDYSFNATAADLTNAINSTSSRNITIDTKAPNVTLITFYLNSSDSVDPSGNLTFNATVADNRMSVGTVILQYHNGTTWANKTMVSQGSNVYQANISLAITNQSYAYNIYANDTVGNINLTTNATFNSFFDCTFAITPSDLGATAGFSENKFTGNISINNTGDSDYPNSACALRFRLTHELTEGRVCFNDDCVKPSNTIDLAAKVNTTVKTNGSFLSEIKEETFNISISELTFRASTNHSNASISLVSTTGGPYLFQKITASPATLSLITQNFTLEGYVRNLVGDGTTNNTAYNVTLNWTLPSDFLLRNGNTSSNFTNLSDNSLQQKPINITLNSTNLPSMSAGTLTVSLYSQGTNSTNTLINHTGGRTILVEQVNITFTCSNVSDGIIVTACSSLDGDFVAAPSSSSSTTGGGGGGGSSGGEIVETVQTTSDFQIVRGKQNTIQIPFINKDTNDSIRDITIKVSGNIAKYIAISPSSIPSLGPGDETTLSLLITSPSYLPLGREEIKIEIDGRLRNEVYKEIKKIVLEIHELSQEEARALLKESQALMKKFNEAGFNITSLNNLLAESQKVINDFAYEKVRDNHAIIKNTVTKSLDSKKIIDDLTALIAIAEEKGIPVPESSKLLKLAKLSLERNDFEEAFARAKEAQVAYALEVKGEIGKLVYYVKNYPGTISLTAIILVLFSVTAYKITKFNYISSRIKRLREEELILTELMKVVQRDAFDKKSMSMEEYETAMHQYEQKLEKVIEEIIELESKRAYALKFTGEKSRLSLERDRLISLIKELQRDYLQKGKMETRSYELKTESYNRRIGEIDQYLATLEAKQATKGGLNIFR